jgi:transposase
MRKIREVLRLRWDLERGVREVARSVNVSHSTVIDILRRAEAAGVTWPLPDELDEARLQQMLYPVVKANREKPEPDWGRVHKELFRKGVTLNLLWLEYRAQHPDGYGYSRFCQLYRKWRGKLDVVLRQRHRAGEKMFIDFAGQKVRIVDGFTGEVQYAEVFVATLGASNYTYAEAMASQDLTSWIGGHIRAFEFFDGVTALVIPEYVPRNIFWVMPPAGLCAGGPRQPPCDETGRPTTPVLGHIIITATRANSGAPHLTAIRG